MRKLEAMDWTLLALVCLYWLTRSQTVGLVGLIFVLVWAGSAIRNRVRRLSPRAKKHVMGVAVVAVMAIGLMCWALITGQ